MTDGEPGGLPGLNEAELIARRDEILLQIGELEAERDHIEAVLAIAKARRTGTARTGTYRIVRGYFDEHETGTPEQVHQWATENGWANPARDRLGAISSALSREAGRGHLVNITGKGRKGAVYRRPPQDPPPFDPDAWIAGMRDGES